VAGIAAVGVADPSVAGAAGAVPTPSATVPFYGPHQAGIATESQEHLVFAAYDLATDSPRALGSLLSAWTKAAARLTAGQSLGGDDRPGAAPADTGEALGLGAANLTVTVGFGPGLFDHRLGLGHLRPAALAELPAFPLDALDASRSGGDLCIQACADDPQVAFHAVHNLTRVALGTATLRYTQLGFGMRAPGAAGGGPQTPRNLLGFHDGTANRQILDGSGPEKVVWVGDGDQPWMAGGTYLVARRIRIYLEAWARTSLENQEAAVGRQKMSGAPMGGRHQFDRLDLAATGPGGLPVIPATAHVRLASAASNDGAQILRRSYNFADGVDPLTGELDAGLFFICFQRDPAKGFVPIQKKLAASDALTGGYLLHTSSAVFACPPGVTGDGHWGKALGLD
jgi:deferrochelatase/peroxidase EfeB